MRPTLARRCRARRRRVFAPLPERLPSRWRHRRGAPNARAHAGRARVIARFAPPAAAPASCGFYRPGAAAIASISITPQPGALVYPFVRLSSSHRHPRRPLPLGGGGLVFGEVLQGLERTLERACAAGGGLEDQRALQA